MRSRDTVLLALTVSTALALASCTNEPGPAPGSSIPPGMTSPPAESSPASPSPSPLPTGSVPVTLDAAEFSSDITHPYFPLPPRTRWTYRELDGSSVLSVTVVATTKTKRIANGVTARVVRDTVRENGKIIEDTFDWYAQDRAGNVWYLGEDTAEFENGKVASRGGSFEAGVDGAQPGIIMPAEPQPGLKYRQEYYRGEAEDNGEILATDQLVQVPAGKYKGAVLTKDTVTIEPSVQEYKLYVKDVGLVLTLDTSGGRGREELTKVDRASPSDGTGPLGDPNP
jgi:hypothetical protein